MESSTNKRPWITHDIPLVRSKYQKLQERTLSSKEKDVCSISELQGRVMCLIDKNQSFEQLLKENSSQLRNDREKEPKEQLTNLTTSLTVDSCVSVLKAQASQVSLPLSLLAPELLANELCTGLQTSEGEREHLLTETEDHHVSTILGVVDSLISEHAFNRIHFGKCLLKKVDAVPLELIWRLNKNHILSFCSFLACCAESARAVLFVVDGMISLCCAKHSCLQRRAKIVSDLLESLMQLSYPETKREEGNQSLEKVAKMVLDQVASGCTRNIERISVWKILQENQIISRNNLRQFCNEQLRKMFDEPSPISYPEVFLQQKQWSFASLPEHIVLRYQQILLILEGSSVINILENYLEKGSVNWQNFLSLLSVLVVCVKSSPEMVKGLSAKLIKMSLEGYNLAYLGSGFLLIRQLVLEGHHLGLTYTAWFQSMFGEGGENVLNNKKEVQFFYQFLNQIVPYESGQFIKVHVLKPPFVPPKLHHFVSDYNALAKTRLADLKESLDDTSLFSESGKGDDRSKTAQVTQQDQAAEDVEKVLQAFQKTGKVPSSVMEASIFRKPYFIGRFLPALLIPQADADKTERKNLIETLKKAGKIPRSLLSGYHKACERLAVGEISSSDEDLAGEELVEKLCSRISNLTEVILESLSPQTNHAKPELSIHLSVITRHLKTLFPGPQPADLSTCVIVIDALYPEMKTNQIRICEALLNMFIKTYMAVSQSVDDDSGMIQWTDSIIAMVTSTPEMLECLLTRLWSLLTNQMSSLKLQHVLGLAAFCCFLDNHTTCRVLISDSRPKQRLAEEPSRFSEVLANVLPLQKIKSTFRWWSSYLLCAVKHYEKITTIPLVGKKLSDSSVCFVPCSVIQTVIYLQKRFTFGGHDPDLEPLIEQTSTMLKSLPVSLQQDLPPQLSFKEWLVLELGITLNDDHLNTDQRYHYYHHMLYEHFIPCGVSQGGCGGNYVMVCSTILQTLWQHADRWRGNERCTHMPKQPTMNNKSSSNGRSMLLKLLKESVQLLAKHSNKTNSKEPQWLIRCFQDGMKQLQKNASSTVEEASCVDDVNLINAIHSFVEIATALPPYLLFGDAVCMPLPSSVKHLAEFINYYVRPCLSEGGILLFSFTDHVIKGIVSYFGCDDDINWCDPDGITDELLKHCPILLSSFQQYWPVLKPQFHSLPSSTVFSRLERLQSWISRFRSSDIEVFGSTLECQESACVLATCLFHFLDSSKEHCSSSTEKVMSMLKLQLKKTERFHETVACLFDCLLMRVSTLLASGSQMSQFMNIKSCFSELAVNFPEVFRVLDDEDASPRIEILRSKIHHQRLRELYPVAWFSLMMDVPEARLMQAARNEPFLPCCLRMHGEFLALHRNHFDSDAFQSVLCKSLDIEFVKQVLTWMVKCISVTPKNILQQLDQTILQNSDPQLQKTIRHKR